MSENTSVNSQITDSVTQTTTKVIGESPASAMSNMYQNISDEGQQNTDDNQQPENMQSADTDEKSSEE
jgi:hypothetical protein